MWLPRESGPKLSLCGLRELFLIISHLILVRLLFQLFCIVKAEPSAKQARIGVWNILQEMVLLGINIHYMLEQAIW